MISIITITYNRADSLKKTFTSVLAQTNQNFEYVVIDGRSNDDTSKIVRDMGERVNVFLSEADQGIADALNKGIEHSTGDWIFYLHSDDYLEPNAVENFVAAVAANPQADFIAFGIRYVDATGNPLSDFMPKLDKSEIIHEGMRFPHTGLMMNRRVLDKVGQFDLNYKIAMDYDFILRSIKSNSEFVIVPKVVNNMGIEGVSSKRFYLAQIENFRAKTSRYGHKLVFYYVLCRNFSVYALKSVLRCTPFYPQLKKLKQVLFPIK